jgi:hypothetical protein
MKGNDKKENYRQATLPMKVDMIEAMVIGSIIPSTKLQLFRQL